MQLSEEVRRHCAEVAARACWVRIDLDAAQLVEPSPAPALDPERHFLEGDPEQVARYLMTLNAVNFGSGWFPQLRKRQSNGAAVSGYFTVAWALADHFRAHGPWNSRALATMTTQQIAAVLEQTPDLELMSLYAQGLRGLGAFLDGRDVLSVVAEARGSAQALARGLASGMAMFADVGFYKRAQIAVCDLALAGLASFTDLDQLTIFADNLVPHVLRCDGVLVYEERLAEHIDAGRPLAMGQAEREIRACAVHACESISRRTGVPPRTVDGWLWHRGQGADYKARLRHRTRTVYY